MKKALEEKRNDSVIYYFSDNNHSDCGVSETFQKGKNKELRLIMFIPKPKKEQV